MSGTKRVINPAGAYNLPIDLTFEEEEFVCSNTINLGDAVALIPASGLSASTALTYGTVVVPTQMEVIQAISTTQSAYVIGIALDAGVAGGTIRVCTHGICIAHTPTTTAIAAFAIVAAGNNAAATGSGTISTATATTDQLTIGVALQAFTSEVNTLGTYGYIFVNKA